MSLLTAMITFSEHKLRTIFRNHGVQKASVTAWLQQETKARVN